MRPVQEFKVLVVDDHFIARQIVTDVMRDMDITNVVAVGDGQSARDALLAAHASGEPFDIVYLDRNLPHLEGMEVLQQFRARPEFNNTAFIMLTSMSEQSDVLKAIKAGATSYLVKPVTKQAIGKKLAEAAAWLEQKKKA